MSVQEIAGVRVHVCAPDGPTLADDRNLSELIGEMFSAGAGMAAIPLTRLGPDFLRLSSGVAGAVLQKLVNYRFRVAVVGDVFAAAAASHPLRDFIRESNRGTTVWFVDDLGDLEARLAPTAQPRG
ncbi:MAG TPA: DUF4180 domain-containing protein [Phenylobacterium sp.]|jgi:hypothetical protein